MGTIKHNIRNYTIYLIKTVESVAIRASAAVIVDFATTHLQEEHTGSDAKQAPEAAAAGSAVTITRTTHFKYFRNSITNYYFSLKLSSL